MQGANGEIIPSPQREIKDVDGRNKSSMTLVRLEVA
jgi:hypothetical protein